MRLMELRIRRELYGSNKGQMLGVAEFAGDLGTVSVCLDDARCQRILELCAESIIAESRKVADAMILPVLEAAEIHRLEEQGQ